MGKRRLEKVRCEIENCGQHLYGQNNPHSDQIPQVIQKKEQKHQAEYKQVQTKVYRRFRKLYHKMFIADLKNNSLKVFGYWKYWILEGKIGPMNEKGEIV